ncbi:MAG: DUF2461 domain-containing protein, partial [Pseudomonadota bacterium]
MTFAGFPEDCLAFYRELARRNNREWFEAHKKDFDRQVMVPAREFVAAMGQKLKTISPGLIADPRVNRSLFRLQRDTRFSPDKTPYKTHLALWFWEGAGPRMECSGYYFHLEPNRLMLAAGIYLFPKGLLEAFRERVAHPRQGAALARAVAEAQKDGQYHLGGQHYKKTPRGYDPAPKNAELLRHNGLYLWMDQEPPPALHSAR